MFKLNYQWFPPKNNYISRKYLILRPLAANKARVLPDQQHPKYRRRADARDLLLTWTWLVCLFGICTEHVLCLDASRCDVSKRRRLTSSRRGTSSNRTFEEDLSIMKAKKMRRTVKRSRKTNVDDGWNCKKNIFLDFVFWREIRSNCYDRRLTISVTRFGENVKDFGEFKGSIEYLGKMLRLIW